VGGKTISQVVSLALVQKPIARVGSPRHQQGDDRLGGQARYPYIGSTRDQQQENLEALRYRRPRVQIGRRTRLSRAIHVAETEEKAIQTPAFMWIRQFTGLAHLWAIRQGISRRRAEQFRWLRWGRQESARQHITRSSARWHDHVRNAEEVCRTSAIC